MIDRFIAYIESERRYSPLTVRNYRRDLEAFAKWFNAQLNLEQFDVRAVATDDVRDWIMYRIDTQKISSASMNRELSSLKSFFRYLRKIKVVEKDILKTIGSLKTPKELPLVVPKSRMQRVLSTAEEQSYSTQFKEQRNSLIISLFYGCGIRLAELNNIKVKDISDGSVRILGKGDKQRIVPLLAELEERIERYKECCHACKIELNPDSYLIVNTKAEQLSRSTIQRVVLSQLDSAAVKGRKSPHVLRHTFATQLLDSGADMREIQELLGHASLSSTQHYTHNSIGQLKEVYKRAHPHK